MVQLTLTLKSNRPSTVYSYNGKSYRLQPGSNTLNLEYDDYLALAKALSIKPIAKEPVSNINKEVKEEPAEAPTVDELVKEPEPSEDINDSKDEDIQLNESNSEATVEQAEEQVTESKDEVVEEAVDYSTWSYSKLKAEYKAITGNSCKLKKDEVIAFLQEHSNV